MKKLSQFASVLVVGLAASLASAHAAGLTPFVNAEATYTDADLNSSTSVYGDGLDGYEIGAGLTIGVFINARHEISIGTGFTDWKGTPVINPTFVRTDTEVEQIPVLLNYRYHVPLDSQDRFTLFAGPTVGFIHQKLTVTNTNLGFLPPPLAGSETQTDWVFAYGATVGLNAAISAHWTVGLAAQVLVVEESEFTTFGGFGPFGKFERQTRPSFTVAVGYSW